MGSTSIPEDLRLIMQSYVDIARKETQPDDDDWSEGEDEVEATIRVEPDDDGPDIPKSTTNDESSSESDSDAESSASIPTKTILVKPDDSDDEDSHVQSTQAYAGTKNEILIPEVEVPEMTSVPLDDALEPVGQILSIIDSVVVVQGHGVDVRRALDTDSLLVFEDRKVLGKVFETFGAVKQPLYSVRFPSATSIDKTAIWIGRVVFHVPTRSNYVFTEAIARIKGSDASNLHDEEVGEDQIDFSDDEAEEAWRRTRKAAKRRERQASPPLETSVRQSPQRQDSPQRQHVPLLVGDDGDVPYSAAPYEDTPDPRPAPAAYDPYLDEEPKAVAQPRSPSPRRQIQTQTRGRGRGRRDKRQSGPGERGRRGRGRGRGGGGRGRAHEYHGHGMSSNHSFGEPSQFASGPYAQDEAYSPINAASGFNADADNMPHINPRFLSGEMGVNVPFGMPWGDMSAYGYGFQQPGWFGQGDQMGYNWPMDEQYHGQYDQARGSHRNPHNGM